MRICPRNIVVATQGLILLVLCFSISQPVQAASWVSNTPMATAREKHTATLLPDGRVLVAGGYRYGNLFGAELYDPATGTWTTTVQLTTARSGHTATLLLNGKVLVAGGFGDNDSLSQAELYDPVIGTWMATSALKMARRWHTATLLPNGKVLVAGGRVNRGVVNDAELYDPSSGTWAVTAGLTSARMVHTATLLPNGKVLVVGGWSGGSISNAELYNPVTGMWTATSPVPVGRDNHTATLLPNGKVLVAGGYGTSHLAGAVLYNPATETWTATGAMNAARSSHAATLLPNGKVLVAGGFNNNNNTTNGSGTLSTTELYDPATETWTMIGPLATARYDHTATLLANGKVLVAGGYDNTNFLSGSELYDSGNGSWTNVAVMSAARYSHTATLLTNGTILVAGGIGGVSSSEIYHPAIRTWTNTGSLNVPRWQHTATLLPDGKVLAAGGVGLSSAELYDPAAGAWLTTGDMSDPRRLHTATLLPSGRVLVVGGIGANSTLSSAELYNPMTKTWTTTRPMNAVRFSHSATLLPNGKVLIAGGDAATANPLSSAELYDPSSETWTPTGPLITARVEQTATLLPNGLVLVAGGLGRSGNSFDPLSSVELYNPAAGTWNATGAMNNPRRLHAATLLLDGRVLITGGGYANGSYLSSAELYDPAAGKWTTTGSMFLNRGLHRTTLLPDGTILVSGGLSTWQANAHTATNGAELFNAGLGFSNSWQPRIVSLTSPLYLGSSLVITGSQFRGVSGASGGNLQDSSSDYPLVQLRSIESAQTMFLLTGNWSTNSFTSLTVTNFPPGWALATVFVNGIPSTSGFTLVIKGAATMTLSNLLQAYDGTPKPVFVATAPLGLPVNLTYTGLTNAPVNAGSYTVVATINDANYQGCATNTLVISKATATVTLSNLNQTYEGNARIVTVITSPAGLPVILTYNGTTNAPINAGSYTVIGAVNHVNYQGSATSTLVVGKAIGSVNLSNLVQTYDGTAKTVSVVTAPPSLPVNVTYNGSPNAPTNIGSYTVIGTINHQNYQGSATNRLGIVAPFGTARPMTLARQSHTATLLPNGKVLIAGGYNNGVYPAGAELYDPATGTWTNAGTMSIARQNHTATMLPNGKVLVAGGFNGNTVSIAEFYDPATDTWTPTGSLNTPRFLHTATLLLDGKVLVAGGAKIGGDSLPSAELYDPGTGTWTPTGPMTNAHVNHTATLLPNGNVLVAGGQFTPNAEQYDPATGIWMATGEMNTPRSGHNATLLPNGKVLATGGSDNNSYLSSAELFDPATEKWTVTDTMNTAHCFHSATLLPNGQVLVAGGIFDFVRGFYPTTSAELYDPIAGRWTPAGIMSNARVIHSATLLSDGRVLLVGGFGTAGPISSSELYESAIGAWANTGALNSARFSHTSTLLPNGEVLVAGGEGEFFATNSAELYHPTTGTWSVAARMNSGREQHMAVLLANGKVLVFGGYGGSPGSIANLSSAELFDPTSGAWANTGAMLIPHQHAGVALLASGKVLVAGGIAGNGVALASSELYDPDNGQWTNTGTLNAPRYDSPAVVLANGKVLLAGGSGSTGVLSTAVLYDSTVGAWTPTGSLKTTRTAHTATLLPTGKILVAGGFSSSAGYLSSAEVYDPATGTWTEIEPMVGIHWHHKAILLRTGQVLIVGGYGGDLKRSAITELYDPATGTWAKSTTMIPHGSAHTATLLPSGKVLIAGGDVELPAFYPLSLAELYDVGLGFSNSWQPQIASVISPLYLGSSLVITGSQFRGVSGASGGNTHDSPTDYPLAQLRSIESGETTFLLTTNWSTNSFTSLPLWNFPPGYAMVTVFVNGIPSQSSIVAVLSPCDIETSVTGPSTVSPGVSFGCVCGVTNLGPGAADNVIVSWPVPSGLTFTDATANGQVTNGLIIWNIGTLAAAAGSSFSATFKAPAAGSFTNVVTVTSSTPDTNAANDSARVITTVTEGTLSSFVSRPTLNPLTGAYEELVTVTNIGNPLVAVRLLVGDLPAQVSLHNAAGTNGGKPYVEHTVVMNTGDSRTFLLQFANPYRLNFTNTVEVIAVLPQTPATNTAAGVIISRVFMDATIPDAPRFTFAFASIAGRSYQILFSDDAMQTWSVANTVTPSSNWTIWTEMLPTAETRLFKVVLLP